MSRISRFKRNAFFFVGVLAASITGSMNLHAESDKVISKADIDQYTFTWTQCGNEWVVTCKCDATSGNGADTVSFRGRNKDMLKLECYKSMSNQGSSIDIRTGNHIHTAKDWSNVTSGSSCSSCSGDSSSAKTPLQKFGIDRYHMYRLMTQQSSLGAGVFLSWDINVTFYKHKSFTAARMMDPAQKGEVRLLGEDDTETYYDNVFKKSQGITVYDVNGVKIDASALKTINLDDIATAELTKLDGTTLTFEVFGTQGSEVVGRLIKTTDLNGYSTTFSYVHAYDASLTDYTEKWQLSHVTDTNGRVLTVAYEPTKIDNRWVVKEVTLPNTSKVEYNYGTVVGSNDYQKLTEVKYPDLTTSTINRSIDGAHTKMDYFEAGAKGTHRKKSAYMSGSAGIAPELIGRKSVGGVIMYTQASNILRYLTNGSGEVAYLITSANSVYSGKKTVYEGAGSLRDAWVASNAHIKDGWDINLAGTSNEDFFTNKVRESKYYEPVKSGARSLSPSSVKYPDGRNCAYFYDDEYRPIMKIWQKSLGAAGGVSEWRYNNFSKITAYCDRLGHVSLFEYDANGNMTKKKVGYYGDIDNPTAGSEAAEYTYVYHTVASDANNVNLLRYSYDANLNRTEYIYNADHQIIEIREPDDASTGHHTAQTFTYDSAKRLATVTDASGRVTTNAYDLRDRVIQVTYNDGSTDLTTYGSGADSNLVASKTNRDGNRTDYSYDASGRAIQITAGANASSAAKRQVTTFTYLNGTKRVLTKTTNGEVTEYEYDYRKRLVGATVHPKNNVALTSTSTFIDNLLFCKEDPYGRKTYYAYRVSDKALIRTVQGTNAAFSLTDFNSVTNLTRSLSNNVAYIITDYTLDASGQTIEVINGRGVKDTTSYDIRSRVIASTQAASDPSVSATVTNVYDANSNLISRTDARNVETQMAYTRRNKSESETVAFGTPEQATRSTTYLNDGRVNEQFDFENNRTKTLWHSCCNRVQAKIDARGAGIVTNNSYAGLVTHVIAVKDIYDYNTNTVLVSNFHDIADSSTISEITKRYDERNRLIAETKWLVPLGSVDPNNAPIAGDSGYPAADGLTTTYEYYDNASSAITAEITNVLAKLPAGYFGANQTGSAVVATSPTNEKSVSILDGLGRGIIAATLNGSDTVITWNITERDDYDLAEDLLKVKNTDALGNTQVSYGDAVGRVQIAEDALGNRSTAEFDANGNRVKTRDANGLGLDCLFDARDRDYSCTDTQGDNTTKAFDANNNATSVTDAKGKTIASVYDPRNRRTSTTDRLNALTQYTFDKNNNMLTVEDDQNSVTSYEYSNRNELIKTTYPDHVGGTVAGDLNYGITECEFDEAGRKLLCTDQKGNMVQYEYDLVSRLLNRNYFSLGADPLVDTPDNTDTFSYDLASRITSAYKGKYNNTVNHTYDSTGRANSQSLSYLAKVYNVQWAHDSANRVSSYTYPNSTTITNQFTARNQLDTQYIGANLVADYGYDASGREISREFGNGSITNRTYGRSDNLVTAIDVVGKTNLSTSYTYDPNKNVLTETRGGNMSGTSFTATYDDEDRVNTWARTNGIDTQTWNLSTVGDWVSTTKNGVLQNRTHTAAHEIDSIGGAAVTHDANGNMTVDEAGNIYTWDKDNHLVQIQNSGLVVLAEYAYNAFGGRIAKTKTGVTTVSVHKGQQIVCEYPSTALLTNPSRVYVFSGGYIDDPVMAIDSLGNWFYHHVNRNFNLYGMTDGAGAISEMYAYDVYGK
ncbi:MAG: hypothetical protein V3V74_07535 [Nitrosomonadaceae bacterium]